MDATARWRTCSGATVNVPLWSMRRFWRCACLRGWGKGEADQMTAAPRWLYRRVPRAAAEPGITACRVAVAKPGCITRTQKRSISSM